MKRPICISEVEEHVRKYPNTYFDELIFGLLDKNTPVKRIKEYVEFTADKYNNIY